ncbi:mCG145175, partial [Mus musculus]
STILIDFFSSTHFLVSVQSNGLLFRHFHIYIVMFCSFGPHLLSHIPPPPLAGLFPFLLFLYVICILFSLFFPPLPRDLFLPSQCFFYVHVIHTHTQLYL